MLQSVVTFSNFAKPWLLLYLLRYLNRPTIFYAINSRANSLGQNSGKKKCISVKQHLSCQKRILRNISFTSLSFRRVRRPNYGKKTGESLKGFNEGFSLYHISTSWPGNIDYDNLVNYPLRIYNNLVYRVSLVLRSFMNHWGEIWESARRECSVHVMLIIIFLLFAFTVSSVLSHPKETWTTCLFISSKSKSVPWTSLHGGSFCCFFFCGWLSKSYSRAKTEPRSKQKTMGESPSPPSFFFFLSS